MTKKIILCIDDEVALLSSLKTELKSIFAQDFLIEIAENGHDALELVDELLAEQYEIALVISDYLMPQMRGDELLKRIHLKSPNSIKIMLTGQATIDGVANAIKYARLYRYISKPWQQEDFKLTVIEAVNCYLQAKHLAEKNTSLEKLNAQQTQLIEKLRQHEEHLQNALEAELKLKVHLQNALDTEVKLKEIASRFVPNEFLALLGCNNLIDIRLGDAKQQDMSVLFCDIRDFTQLSEIMTPSENFSFISSYLSQMEPMISKNHGFIDKYIGDAIMALFSGSANDAVNAGIAMLRRLVIYNGYRKNNNYAPIKIGIGINTGSLILGTIGTEKRMDGTVISDAVNLAARIESLTKHYSSPLLISHHTYASLQQPENYAIRMIDLVTVKGKTERVTVYEVFDADPEHMKAAKLFTLDLFTTAISAYNDKHFEQARALFRHCLAVNPDDNVGKIYLDRLMQQL